ncbi:Predicted flavoprotein CzcO associated with the cation diffusion facilitator CzcD [Acinetobacter marinus]|uniref:Predicted flavoprotein CzcO associated with the cation diffusion facilitator CzcD n=1 Tax=Acinetobacter marinus TaxID=281375 RepID=A0A1G6IYU4_9GAMM|nr:NAD(P)/FAD-dependent oxidoreductase [Acinetobacter marinus]SDC11667.1 Predicted flavoprotein CzcO associated with the cation diffusion facilitator CzcD [Acinetobacter marinus]
MNAAYDVIIIGAGLSGIGMACQLAQKNPNKNFTILERRQAIGGTWDLFRYPGIRSDSDMISFGYGFNPWTGNQVLAAGESIRQYVQDTAEKFGLAQKIQFGIKIISADFSTATNQWTVKAVDEQTGESKEFVCNYLVSATGYYNHDQGYLPKFEGEEDYQGIRVHPQHWPEDLDYSNKKVVVIGSGATAVTVVPAMADKTAHITMLQRSPSYVFNIPNTDKILDACKKILPEDVVYKMFRKRNIFIQRSLFKLSRRFPEKMRSFLIDSVRKQLGDDYDMSHFTPKYMPRDERLCAVPDGDLFEAIKSGKASVVTDHIDRFTENGILLKSGKTLEADIIITATGLQIQMLGGIQVTVDHEKINPGDKMSYKGVLLEDVPNFAYLFGYTNAPWTLKIDLACDYICRLIQEMDKRQVAAVKPVAPAGENTGKSIVSSLQSGYVQRGDGVMPRQGRSTEWLVTHSFEKDSAMFGQAIDASALVWTHTTASRMDFKAKVA